MNIKNIVKSISYTFIANIVSIIISMVVTLIIPKFMNEADFGYWQLYIFYTSYLGFLHFGLCDGIYLRYGGYSYQKLPKEKLNSQFWILTTMTILFCIIFIGFIWIHGGIGNEKVIVIVFTGLAAIFYIPKTFLLLTLQATNRIKEFSTLLILDRIIFIIFVIISYTKNEISYVSLGSADLVGRFCVLIVAFYICRDITLGRGISLRMAFYEVKKNIKVGINLLVAGLMGNLIIGVVRFSIEQKWNIIVFGKVSLALSMVNFFLSFVNMVGIVFFPLLKKIPQKNLKEVYVVINFILMALILAIFIIAYPIKWILECWLPQYIDSLNYMLFLLPVCVFESKMAILTNTYLKALRKERTILIINLFSLIISVIFTILTVYIMNNLMLAILSIVVTMGIRCYLSEKYIAKNIQINIKKSSKIEFIIISLFCFMNCFFAEKVTLAVYSIIYLIYLIYIKRNNKGIIEKLWEKN